MSRKTGWLVLGVLMLALAQPARAEGGKLRMVIASSLHQWGIDTRLARELRDEGHEVLVYPDAPSDTERCRAQDRLADWNLLSQYNIIVFGTSANIMLVRLDPKTGLPPDWMVSLVPHLKRFLNEGGGLFITCRPGWDWSASIPAMNYVLREVGLDAEIVPEDVRDSANMTHRSPPLPPWGDFTWTDKVTDDPLTRGVPGLWYPMTSLPDGTTTVNPVKVGPAWKVLVTGMPTAASYAKDPTDNTKGERYLPEPGAYKSSPPMIAVREFGKGRVVLWPTDTNFGIGDGWNPAVGGLTMDGEIGGRKSGGAQLLKNLLTWLAAPSQGSRTIGLFDPKTYVPKPFEPELGFFTEEEWMKDVKPGAVDYASQYKALIGAHSSLSDGASSPEEMIAAAKKAGYQFLAFTEDLPGMNEEKWKTLVALCDKASDAEFVACPGLDLMDEAGDRIVVFGQRWWVKDEWRSKTYPGRIVYLNNLTYMADPDAHKWAPSCIIRAKTNNKRAWEQALWRHFSPFCYEGGKLVDESLNEWLLTVSRYGFYSNTGMMSVHTVKSAADIAATADPNLMQTYVRADKVADIPSSLDGVYGPDPGAYYPSYISSGPEIVQYRIYNFGTSDLTIPGNDRSVMHIRARSPAGLKEVQVLLDDGEPGPRLLPEGNEFEILMNIFKDAQHQYVVRVTDKLGGVAYSWVNYTEVQDVNRKRCGDNWNYVRYGQGGGTSPRGYSGHDGEAAPRYTPPVYIGQSAAPGHAGAVCSAGARFSASNALLVEGKPAESYTPLMSLNLHMIGRFGEIFVNEFPRNYKVQRPDPWTTAAFQGPYTAIETPWPTEIKVYMPMKKYDGVQVTLVEGRTNFVKEISTADGKPVKLEIATEGDYSIAPLKPGQALLEIVEPDGASKKFPLADLRPAESYTGEIPVGGYMAWYGPDAAGIGAIIALEPGVSYSCSRTWLSVFKEVAVPVKAGTQVSWRCVMINGSGLAANTKAEIEAVRVGMGLCGKPAFYNVEPRTGRVESQELFLKVTGEDFGFSGKINTRSELPIHLPVMVAGLNRRWDAGIWYRGSADLAQVHYYRDKFGELSPYRTVADTVTFENAIQHMPILADGTGYCYVQTAKTQPDVFIGNFLVCNRPEVFITLVKAEKGRCTFEINNPTDKPLTCAVRPAKGFDLVGKFTKKVKLPAGGWESVTVDLKQ